MHCCHQGSTQPHATARLSLDWCPLVGCRSMVGNLLPEHVSVTSTSPRLFSPHANCPDPMHKVSPRAALPSPGSCLRPYNLSSKHVKTGWPLKRVVGVSTVVFPLAVNCLSSSCECTRSLQNLVGYNAKPRQAHVRSTPTSLTELAGDIPVNTELRLTDT